MDDVAPSSSRIATVAGHASVESQTTNRIDRFFRTLSTPLLVALSYYVASRIGFTFTPANRAISTFWPPNAVLLAALLLTPRRIWWRLLIAVLPAHFFVQLENGVPTWTAIGSFIGNVGEALIGALCISYFKKGAALFESVRGVIAFLVFGALLAPLLTSFLHAGVVLGTGLGGDYWMLWSTRLFSNILAELTLVPIIVTVVLHGASWLGRTLVYKQFEALSLAIGVVSVSILAFGGQEGWRGNTPALIYLPLPLLVWASVRFGAGGLSASLLGVALISIWNAMHGLDPFPPGSMLENAVTLQILFCSVGPPLMLLSAFIVELRQTSGKLIIAQEQERRRIARELHDDIGQQLALVALGIHQISEDADSSLKPRFDNLRDQIGRVSQATHEISHGLHPSFLEHVGLTRAVKRLCLEAATDKSLSVSFTEENVPKDLPQNIALCLYRVAQEALQNVMKHSHAHNVKVELRTKGARVFLLVIDDGFGFPTPPEARVGLGFASMQERLRMVGGRLDIVSTPMQGTRIKVSAPTKEP